jgi:hypothetical protein
MNDYRMYIYEHSQLFFFWFAMIGTRRLRPTAHHDSKVLNACPSLPCGQQLYVHLSHISGRRCDDDDDDGKSVH